MDAVTKEIFDIHDVEHNQKYSIFPYSHHLKLVIEEYEKFKYLIPEIAHYSIFRAVSLHDILEDTGFNYEGIKTFLKDKGYEKAKRELIAEIVYCVTDEKGRNRKERKNEKYYKELRENDYAVFVKLCDIAANTKFSKTSKGGMYNMYKSEFKTFKEKVYTGQWDDLFDYVEKL